MSDLGPIVDLRLELTAAQKEIERLTAENAALRSAFGSLKLQVAVIAGICDAATEQGGSE